MNSDNYLRCEFLCSVYPALAIRWHAGTDWTLFEVVYSSWQMAQPQSI